MISDKALLLLNSPLEKGPEAVSYQKQLSQRLKQAILSGQLAAESKLPSSRTLAGDLAISRNTVQIVYEQLTAEGYIVANRQGSRVARLSGSKEKAKAVPVSKIFHAMPNLSPMRSRDPDASMLPLTPGVPALNRFPVNAWRRSWQLALKTQAPSVLGYGDPLGEIRLRQAIAQYLSVTRGVRCEASRIIITPGAKGALSLCVKLFTKPGDTAWLEEPGYHGARAVFQAGNLNVVAMRIDSEGFKFSQQAWLNDPPRLIHLTPSHQYPTGGVLPITRRLALIKQARETGSWIIEDDYDSEFRHYGEPIAAMQGLQPDAPVLYVGTFSKMMFPSISLGFLVLPEFVVIPDGLGEMLNGGGHRIEQLAMANFIESGQFSRHLNRMRRLYRERQLALRSALEQHLNVDFRISGGEGGMHLTVHLPAEYPDRKIVDEARKYGINPARLSDYAMQPQPEDNGLVIGYGNTATELFIPLIKRLGKIIRRLHISPG